MKNDPVSENIHDGGDINSRARFKKIAIAAARLADSKKAESVTVYDMAGRSELADFVVVATADNPAQLEAVDDEVSVNLKQEGLFALYRDGMRSKNWRVLDYGGIIIHLFEKQARDFYAFDKVYAGYSVVNWHEKAKAPPAIQKRTKAAPTRSGTAAKKIKKPAAEKSKKTAKKAPVRKPAPRKQPSKKKKK